MDRTLLFLVFKPYRLASIRLFIILLSCSISSELLARTVIFQQRDSSPPGSTRYDVEVPSQNSVSETSESIPVDQVGAGASGNGVSNTAATSELFFMIEQLQQEVRELKGLVEELQYDLESHKEVAKTRYRDLDSRLLGLTKKVGGVAGSGNNFSGSATNLEADSSFAVQQSAVSTLESKVVPVGAAEEARPRVEAEKDTPSVVTPEQQRDYQAAYNFMKKEKRFDEAVDRFYQYIEKHPEGELTGNAYYWLGELYLSLRKLEQAKNAFLVVERSFPDHGKSADTLFKLGVTYDLLQERSNSEQYLKRVQSEFPGSSAAKLALKYKINR